MGRLVNVIGVRPKLLDSSIIKGNWHKSRGIEELNLIKFITVFFGFKKVQSLGLLLNNISIEKKGSSCLCVLSVYDSRFMLLNYSNLPAKGSKFKKTLLGKEYSLKILILEKLLLRGLRLLTKESVSIRFDLVGNDDVSAFLVCNYMIFKLKQNFRLGSVLYPLARFLKFHKNFHGFRIDCRGRYTRRQRASFLSLKEGRIPFASRNVLLDYAFNDVILKFGKCGLKVWLHRDFKTNKQGILSMLG